MRSPWKAHTRGPTSKNTGVWAARASCTICMTAVGSSSSNTKPLTTSAAAAWMVADAAGGMAAIPYSSGSDVKSKREQKLC